MSEEEKKKENEEKNQEMVRVDILDEVLKLSAIASRDLTRKGISVIHMTKNYSEASNGSLLVRLNHVRSEIVPEYSVLLHRKHAERVLKDKMKRTCAVLDTKDRTIIYNDSELGNYAVKTESASDYTFPGKSTTEILKKSEEWKKEGTSICLDAELLCKLSCVINAKNKRGVRLFFKSKNEPIVVESLSRPEEYQALLMPIRD